MTIILFSIIGALLTIFQSTAFRLAGALGGVLPNFSIIIIVFYALKRGPFEGEIVGAVIGITLDLLGILPFGLFLFTCSLLGFVIGKLRGAFVSNHWFFWPVGMVLISLLIWNLTLLLLGSVFDLNLIRNIFSLKNLLEIGYTLLFTPLLFVAANKILNLLNRRPGGSFK